MTLRLETQWTTSKEVGEEEKKVGGERRNEREGRGGGRLYTGDAHPTETKERVNADAIPLGFPRSRARTTVRGCACPLP